MRATMLSFLLVAATTLIAFADEPARSPAVSGTIVPAEWQPLHARWQAAVEELKIPGMAVVVVKGNDVVLLDAFGICKPDGKQPVTPRSPFYLASVTKSFTALGIATLVEEGKLKLDEPVKTYLPQFTLSDKKLADTVTLRDLLCHRYGLNSEPIAMGEAYFGNMSDERYYRLLNGVRSPGKFAYSNLHYTLLGRVIEAVSGTSWKDYLAERVFAPIGMSDSTAYASKMYANPLAAWPFADPADAWQLAPIIKNDSVMHAAGGMGASASDLGNWLRFHITGKTPDGRQLVSPELLRDVHTRQASMEKPAVGPPGVTRDGYSLGWVTGTCYGHVMLEHGGGYLGTATSVSFLPEDNVGVTVLVNQARGAVPMAVTLDIYAKLLGVSVEDLWPTVRKGTAAQLERKLKRARESWDAPAASTGLTQPIEQYVGKYENAFWGDADVSAKDDRLVLTIGTLNVRWHGLGEDRFRVQITPGDTFEGRFKTDADGKIEALLVNTPLGGTRFSKAK